ncbi:transcription-repair coupling factor [candidate division KSB1 bacterium]|nr:transcription-repair coupling factor [candidate division KSB1 bacterium]
MDYIQKLTQQIFSESSFKFIINKAIDGQSYSLRGLTGSLETLLLHKLFAATNRSMLVLYPDSEQAEFAWEELLALSDKETAGFFPETEHEISAPAYLNPHQAGRQMEAVRQLLSGIPRIIVTTATGALQPLPNQEHLKDDVLSFQKGAKYNLTHLLERLIDFGYDREFMVERPGEISLRGGILDIFPYTGEVPHRVEFFGDEIESIRMFEIETQRSTDAGISLQIVPVPSYWKDRSDCLLDYFKEDFIFQSDPDLFWQVLESEDHPKKQFEEKIQGIQTITHYTFAIPQDTLDAGGRPVPTSIRTVSEIRSMLELRCQDRNPVYLVCQQSDQIERLVDLFHLDENPIQYLKVISAPIHRGFDLPNARLTVYTERELFGRKAMIRKRMRIKEGAPIRELAALKRGDFMVHIDYGIGRYQGLEQITVRGAERECLLLEYQDGDKVYVPVEKMERVQKYAGRDSAVPALSKLGTAKWERIKERTKNAIKEIAEDLIRLYSVRHALPGFAFPPDSTWERELEASFEYPETKDQTLAIQEVKEDMEKERSMDRLICGDVGYGKTEVAIRAAFKSINSGKQVAVLVPTTILAQQHYNTFLDRLSAFPVEIEMLSRFRSKKEQAETVRKLREGSVDIVIGTHRLLSKDVGFKDLGLLIIDEEHRFGVKHKERLKSYRSTVDVLALSATPIPRTLHLSMIQIRDMSLINTAPKDRMPIHTEVLPFGEEIIQEAIYREMARKGQVFFVHNRIQTIEAVGEMIRRLVPGIRLCVAHGQMNEHTLERKMTEFVQGKYDCLVATMIIESGLDMPHVNTLLVNRADRMGLAQLYQLRGRVGRSDVRAYAYLFTPPFALLSPEAVKRLRTIEEFTELGAGFQIALRDLEIRGTGNLLGVQQSGFMDAVGFELYTRLITEAVEEIKSEASETPVPLKQIECTVDTEAPAHFPDDYISDETIRINIYRRLIGLDSESAVDQLAHELEDRFGVLPDPAENLLEITRIRLLGESRGFERIQVDQEAVRLYFHPDWVDSFPTPEQFSEHLRSIIASSDDPIKFLQQKGFGVRVQNPETDAIQFTKKLLHRWG